MSDAQVPKYDRVRIVTLYDFKISFKEITTYIDVSLRTCFDIDIKRYKETEKIFIGKRLSRPTKYTRRDERKILSIVRKNFFMPVDEIKNIMITKVSTRMYS